MVSEGGVGSSRCASSEYEPGTGRLRDGSTGASGLAGETSVRLRLCERGPDEVVRGPGRGEVGRAGAAAGEVEGARGRAVGE